MEKFLDVIIVLAAVAIMIARSYRKTKNAPRPQIDPRGEAPAVEETPSAGGASVEPPPIPPVAWQTPAEELPPIPPVARRMAEQEAEKEKEKAAESKKKSSFGGSGFELDDLEIPSFLRRND